MEESKNNARIEPVRLALKSELKFECHKDVSCFTKCCRGINIMLTPYDIIRMKKRLELSSEEFLAIYTKPEILEKTDLPVVTLKLLDDEKESCPFVRDDGCIIYEDRPTTCRYYPVGVASLSYQPEDDSDEGGFYFLIEEPHCKGFEEKKRQTVKEWRKNQKIDIHDEINAGWTDLLVKKRSFPKNIKLTDKAKKMFFLISYNIDKFKSFIFETSFLEKYELDEKIIKNIKTDEIELLKFGIKWLTWLLYEKNQTGRKFTY
jgi:uncharacterized protein